MYIFYFELLTNYNSFCIYLTQKMLIQVLLHFGPISVEAEFINIYGHELKLKVLFCK